MNVLGEAYVVMAHENYRGIGLSVICRRKAKTEINIRDFQIDHYRDANKTVKACAVGASIGKSTIAFVC